MSDLSRSYEYQCLKSQLSSIRKEITEVEQLIKSNQSYDEQYSAEKPYDAESISVNVVNLRVRESECLNKMRKLEYEMEDEISRNNLKIKKALSQDNELGEVFFGTAKEKILRANRLENLEDIDYERIRELRREAEVHLKLAIKSGFAKPEVFFILAQLYDLEGNLHKAFECYTTSIKLDDNFIESYRSRITLCESLIELEDENFEVARYFLLRDKRKLQELEESAIIQTRRTSNEQIFTEKTDRIRLFLAIKKHFNGGELRTFCFNLKIEYDNLNGETTEDKVRELISYFERRGQISDLVKQLLHDRPNAEL